MVQVGRDEEALSVLNKLHEPTEAKKEIGEIKHSLQDEESASSKTVSIFQKAVLHIILIGSALSLLQQFTGINAVLYYGGDIFEKALGYGQEDILAQQILLGAVNFGFTFVAMYTVDKWGRKPLILFGSYGMLLGFILLGGSLYFGQVGIVSLIGVLMFIGSFALSMGPVTWVLLSEMFPNSVRSAAMSIAVAVQWAGNYLVSQTFPIMAESEINVSGVFNKSLPYVVFGICLIILIVFIKTYVVETKGKTLEELEDVWAEQYGNIES